MNLYRAAGFREIRRLIGFAGPPLDVVSEGAAQSNGNIASDFVEVDLREVAQAVTRYGLPDLPWQLSGETIAQLAPTNVAYRLNGAWMALTNPTTPTVTVRALIADKSLPTLSREATVLRAIMAKHPGRKEWRFSAIWPEEHDVMGIRWVDGQTGRGQPVSKRARANQLADIISPVALSRSPLTQWQMEREM